MELVDIVTGVIERRLENLVATLLEDEPVVALTGPRTVGKSTLLRRLAGRVDREVLDLDDPTVREQVRGDLAGYLAGPSPVFIDEFQHVVEVLDAIKAQLNLDTRPGRFLLAGSTRYATLPRTAQSLTGRVHVETVWPLSQGELSGTRESFLEDLIEGDHVARPARASNTSREDYAERTLGGGLPAALRRPSGPARVRWFQSYVDLVIQRDVVEISAIRQSAVLPAFLRRLVAQTGQVLNIAHASREAGVTPSVGEDYARLLESVFLIHRLPAWGTTLASRVNRNPKIHIVDTGLGGWLMGLSEASVARRIPAVMTEFGHLLETFVVNELLKQAGWLQTGVRSGHYRTSDGHEVDLVLETWSGDVVAIEVKAGSSYRDEDLRGLRHLRDRLGSRFRRGVLLYTGRTAGAADDRLLTLPIDTIWQ